MEAQSVSQETPLLTDLYAAAAAAVKTVYKISIPGLP